MTTSRPVGLFIGLSTLDVIQLVERVPASDEKVIASDITLAAGGPASNAAVAFAALGGRATLVTRIASDMPSQMLLADLVEQGVEVIQFPGAPSTTVASILVTRSTGERAVISAADQGRSASDADAGFDATRLIDDIAPDVVVMDSYETDLSSPLTIVARARSIPVILDCGGKKPYTEQQLRNVDVAVVSERYLAGVPNDIADDIRRFDVGFGAITAGGDPIAYWRPESGSLECMPVDPVPAVVDTLGAGDFFHGALAFRIAQASLRTDTFEDALRFAARVSGLSVQRFGSRSWIPDIAQLIVD